MSIAITTKYNVIMKHFIAETHLPKDGPLHRYLGADVENIKEAKKQFQNLLKDGEYISSIRSLAIDKISKAR